MIKPCIMLARVEGKLWAEQGTTFLSHDALSMHEGQTPAMSPISVMSGSDQVVSRASLLLA